MIKFCKYSFKTIICISSHPPATQGETTSNTSTTEERSQDKIKEIVEMYRSGDYDVRVPEIPELERDFLDVMVKLDHKLACADPQVIRTIRSNVRMEYRTYIYGWKPVELPAVPETPGGLYDFIAAKSTPYEVPLVNCAVQVLKEATLMKTFEAYKSKLADLWRVKLHSCKMRNVTLPKRKDCTHLAAVVSRDKDLVLISLALHIKEYLMKYLQLEETIFEGFGEGCTVLFFSIFRIDAVLLALKILSHSAELKRMFDITHLVVFDYFACDLERATIELPVSVCACVRVCVYMYILFTIIYVSLFLFLSLCFYVYMHVLSVLIQLPSILSMILSSGYFTKN